MKHPLLFVLCFLSFVLHAQNTETPWQNGRVIVSANKHFLQHENGKPFFWLDDTGWLLFQKLSREEVKQYLANRHDKGFNGIQCMVINEMPTHNYYNDSPFVNNDPSKINVTQGNNFNDSVKYDYWDHIEYVIDEAAHFGIYIALVPVWGGVVKKGFFTEESAQNYAAFLAERFSTKPNIFWINGGDIKGSVKPEIWQIIGNTIQEADTNNLMTFHPFGRTQSSTWYHLASWLDFNMCQSGHRRYDQDDSQKHYGEDNWRYILDDFSKIIVKPVLDGEPSYEGIPQGLHDSTQPYWTANDMRRYAYWSVFAGACGHTYGNNAVMQMHKPGDRDAAYGVKEYWYDAINDSGAYQMQYVKDLMLSRPYFERVYDSTLVAGDIGIKYERIMSMRGESYAMFYTYTGRAFDVNMGKISGEKVKAYWYNPRTGKAISIGVFENKGQMHFDPPGEHQNGNDWVLVLDDEGKEFEKLEK